MHGQAGRVAGRRQGGDVAAKTPQRQRYPKPHLGGRLETGAPPRLPLLLPAPLLLLVKHFLKLQEQLMLLLLQPLEFFTHLHHLDGNTQKPQERYGGELAVRSEFAPALWFPPETSSPQFPLFSSSLPPLSSSVPSFYPLLPLLKKIKANARRHQPWKRVESIMRCVFYFAPCLLRSLSLMICLWRALAIALDSFGLSNRAGMVTGSGGASWRGFRNENRFSKVRENTRKRLQNSGDGDGGTKGA